MARAMLRHRRSVGRLVDLVEDAAIGEMRLLRLRPAAEDRIVDGDELESWEACLRSAGSAAAGDRSAGRSAWPRASGLRLNRGTRDRPRPPCACPWRRHCRRPPRPAARPGWRATGTTMSNLSAPNSFSTRKASFSQASSTSPISRWAKVVVEPRAPVSSTGTLRKRSAMNSLVLASSPPARLLAQAQAAR